MAKATDMLQKLIREELEEAIKDLSEERPVNVDAIGDETDRNRSSSYLFTVPNDKEGIERIKRAKEGLSDLFSFRIRPRHDDKKELLGAKYRKGVENTIPIKDAQFLAVYVDPK